MRVVFDSNVLARAHQKKKILEGVKTRVGRTDPLLKTARINAVTKEEDPPFQNQTRKGGAPQKKTKSKSLYCAKDVPPALEAAVVDF